MLRVVHTEWSTGWGGQEIRILLDAGGLLERGFDVTILCAPGSRLAAEARRRAIPTRLLSMRHSFDLRALAGMAHFFRKQGAVVVNTHSSVDSWLASAAAKLAGVPILVRTRHLSVPIPRHCLNVIYKLPDGIVTTGESIRRMMIRDNGLDGAKIFSIPTGVDLKQFGPHVSGAGVRAELRIGMQIPVVAWVAVLRSWKRPEVFLEAARVVKAAMPETVFLLVGDGPGRRTVEEKRRALGLERSVIMTGYREDIPEILAAADACALTSQSAEGVPQSVLQYMAMARPVVATDAGSVSEVVLHGETGLLAPVNDVDAVAAGLIKLLRDRALSRQLGAKGRALVERKYNYETMIERTVEFYGALYRRKCGRNLQGL